MAMFRTFCMAIARGLSEAERTSFRIKKTSNATTVITIKEAAKATVVVTVVVTVVTVVTVVVVTVVIILARL